MFTIKDLATATFSPLYRDGERVDGWYVMYDVDECDRCEVECQAPNAVNVQLEQRTEQLLRFNGQYQEELPDELSYSEGFGGDDAVCSHCYQLEEGGV